MDFLLYQRKSRNNAAAMSTSPPIDAPTIAPTGTDDLCEVPATAGDVFLCPPELVCELLVVPVTDVEAAVELVAFGSGPGTSMVT